MATKIGMRYNMDSYQLAQLLIAIRDRAIETEDGEHRYHQTNDELIITAARFVELQRSGE